MTERAHVCFFPGQLQLGGVGRNTLNLAAELIKRRHRVDLFLSRRAGVYVSEIPSKVRVFAGAGTVKASLPQLVRYLRRERPQLLISARPYINIAAVIASQVARSGVKVVVTERTSVVAQSRLHGPFRKCLVNYACRISYRRAEHIVAVSNSVAAELSETIGIDRSEIQVIYNPVVTERLYTLAGHRIANSWVNESSEPVVLGIGRLARQKNFSLLIRAFAEVRSQVAARLLILGEGEERPLLEDLIEQLGIQPDVHLPGYVENPYAFLARSAVFVLSSSWEGLPTALIEALATGTPVVATDCPGGSREILADGQFGLLTPVDDVGAMATAIRSALQTPHDEHLLRRRAMEFSVGRAADQYLSLIGKRASV